jgi:hypothetical protein
MATQHSDYLVTIDTAFKESGVTEIKVIHPGTLITIRELRSD